MDLANDFNYFAISIDRSREYVKHKPLKYEYGLSNEEEWANLYPVEMSFNKELKRTFIEFNGKKLESYIRFYGGQNIWMITKINLNVLKEFKTGPFGNWSRENLQPFFFKYYKDQYFNYNSIYELSYGQNDWYDMRPLYVYIEPKEDKVVDTDTFSNLIVELNSELESEGHFEERFHDYYSVVPAFLGAKTLGTRVFLHREKGSLVDTSISKDSRRENDGIYLAESVRHFIDFTNNIVQLDEYYYRWANFRFPEIHSLKSKSITVNGIKYAEQLSLECLLSYQEFHKMVYETNSLLKSSLCCYEKYIEHFKKSTDSSYVPKHVATLSFLVFKDHDRYYGKVKGFPMENVDAKLGRINSYVGYFFSITSSKENIKLQKKVFYLSILVLLLAIITILFATFNEDTVIYRLFNLRSGGKN